MRAWDELVTRCALRRREKIGPLSDQAFAELMLAVRENPVSFVDTPAEEAFLTLARALDAWHASASETEALDDEAFQAARARRLAALAHAAEKAVALDGDCLDAHLVGLLAQDLDPDDLLRGLLALERAVGEAEGPLESAGPQGAEAQSPDAQGAGGLRWDDVLARPRLRLRAAVARTCLDGARYRMAQSAATSLLDVDARDPLGARHTLALALVRLEDEPGFDALDARFSGKGDAWSHLGRVILLYKLNRVGAARRALRGFDELCAGGAYALLRPSFVELYLPDRPEVASGSFEESAMAVREAEPIIADVPDFPGWCQDHDWLAASAKRFAEKNDLDW